MNKKIIKMLRYKHDTDNFYKIDKYLKISKINIKEIKEIKKINGGTNYRIKYKYGLNLLNPISWIFILCAWLGGVIEVSKEIFGDVGLDSSYSDVIKVKD
ncbi:hypothetical protein FC831_13815 [Clostridium botulinum]|nr:hypothetical protein [Clostridium botulinum]